MPKKPAIIAVQGFIPMLNPKYPPIKFTTINNTAPNTPLIKSFNKIFNGHASSFTIKNNSTNPPIKKTM